MTLTPEMIELALAGKPEINRAQHIARLKRLIAQARPGNKAWRILEQDYFGDADYIAGYDDGEAVREY